MTPLDQKAMDVRKYALTVACNMHDGQHVTPDTVLGAAQKFLDFVTTRQASAMEPLIPQPSGMPPLPADTLDSVMVQEVSTDELRTLRRQKLFELDVVTNALRSRGVVPA
jgi:hypothetical protein